MEFSHLDSNGQAIMVNIALKPVVKRTAVAYGKVLLQKNTLELLEANLLKKGDALTVAKIAAIAGAKKTAALIPLCHNINLEHVAVEFTKAADGVEIQSAVTACDKTGVEMEALTAVAIAALTIYHMCKAVDKTMRITEIHLLEKKKEEPEHERI